MKDEFRLPDTPFQKTLSSNLFGDKYNILIIAGDIRRDNTDNNESLKDYLINTRLLNLEEQEIINLKQRFTGSKDLLNDIERFIFNYIEDKTIGFPIISALDIIKNKSGDCTEHTILVVSIMRSLGIPSRALVGMLFCKEFEGKKNIFVYHMWAEAYINNKWVIVDAANPGKKYPNRYIAFSYHHLKTEMPLAYLKAVSAIKSFSVEYVE